MKILLISSNSSSRGGGEKFLIYLAKALKDLGHNVEILLSKNKYMNTWVKDFEGLKINVHRYKLKGLVQRKLRFISAIYDFYQIKKVKNICNQVSPNLIIVNQQYDEDGLDYIKGALNSEIKNVIGFMHMPMTASKKDRPLGFLRMNLLRRWYYKNPYKLIFCSKGSEREFKKFYNKFEKSFFVNNSIPLLKIRDYEDYYIRRNNCDFINLTFIGQFVPQKNLFVLLKVWKKLLYKGFKVKLSLIGDGPLFEKIKTSLNDVEGKYWHLQGWCEDIDKYLEETDIYLMPSLFEGCPLGLIEAASKGIHCVVNPFNGAYDIKKYADWIHITQTFKTEDFLYKLESVIVKKIYLNKVCINSLDIFRKYFSLKRMGKEIIDIASYE